VCGAEERGKRGTVVRDASGGGEFDLVGRMVEGEVVRGAELEERLGAVEDAERGVR
jgi:hypothetical protein